MLNIHVETLNIHRESCDGHSAEDVPHDDADDDVISQVENDTFAVIVTVSGSRRDSCVSDRRRSTRLHSVMQPLKYTALITHRNIAILTQCTDYTPSLNHLASIVINEAGRPTHTSAKINRTLRTLQAMKCEVLTLKQNKYH